MRRNKMRYSNLMVLTFLSLTACVHVEHIEHKTPTRNIVREHQNNLNDSIRDSIVRQEQEDRLDQLMWLKN